MMHKETEIQKLALLAKAVAQPYESISVKDGTAVLLIGKNSDCCGGRSYMTDLVGIPDGLYNTKLAAVGIWQVSQASTQRVFPPAGDMSNFIDLDPAVLKSLALVMSDRDVRQSLNGVHINAVGRFLEASDGHRITRVAFPGGCDFVDESVIIPKDAVRAMIRNKMTTLHYSKKHGVAERNGSTMRLLFETVDSKFPDVSRVWPTGQEVGNFTLDSRAVKQVAAYRTAMKARTLPVFFSQSAQAIEVRNYTTDMNTRERVFEVVYQLPAPVTHDACFESDHLSDVLAQGCDEFHIILSGAWKNGLVAVNQGKALVTVVTGVK